MARWSSDRLRMYPDNALRNLLHSQCHGGQAQGSRRNDKPTNRPRDKVEREAEQRSEKNSSYSPTTVSRHPSLFLHRSVASVKPAGQPIKQAPWEDQLRLGYAVSRSNSGPKRKSNTACTTVQRRSSGAGDLAGSPEQE